MLSFVLFFSFLFGFDNSKVSISEDVYHVIFTQGNIQIKSTGEVLKRGMQIKASEKIIFKSKDAKAVVLSSTKGRFVLAPKTANPSSELAIFVNEVVSPLKTNSKLSTRGGNDEKGIQDLKSHFGKVKDTENIQSFAIIGDEYSFKVDIAKYPMNSEKFLGIYYEKPKKVGKAIGFKGNVATISKNGHFLSKEVNPDDVQFVEIRQYDKAKGNFDKEVLASFKPIFIDAQELKASFQEFLSNVVIDEALKTYLMGEKDSEKEVLDKISKMNDLEKKKELLFFFIQECYGQFDENGKVDVQKLKIDENSLENWLKENTF